MNYSDVLGELDAWFTRGVAEAGPDVVLCRRGCSACCNGPFDISPADAELVAAAVSRLPPETRSLVQLRAADQIDQYREIHAGWSSPWDPGKIGDRAFDRLCNRLAKLPCPALGSDGACLIYADRPATCRIIGLPMATAQGETLENNCPIRLTSSRYAEMPPVTFDMAAFEDRAEDRDIEAMERGWRRTTVAGAVMTTESARATDADCRPAGA
jgi:Fe-S-cluster containining protein